jgi:hypothetical protein
MTGLAVIAIAAGLACWRLLSASEARDAPPTITISSTTIGRPIPPGFVGLSLEFQAIPAYAGRDPGAVNPLLVRLIQGLAPGQAPVLRIGGDSTDASWWPARGVDPPRPGSNELGTSWLRITHALAASLGAQLILGVNMAAGKPQIAAAEARAFTGGIGRRYIDAFEIGNEPDLYSRDAWYRAPDGRVVLARPAGYSLGAFIDQFTRWRQALGALPVAGPAFAWLMWMQRAGPAPPPTAHARGLRFELDEMNTVSCHGQGGVSDTFASALWVLNTMFSLARVGVDGVAIHTFPNASYQLFSFRQASGQWLASVKPEYYGLLMFAKAAPPGSRLERVSGPHGPLHAWATVAPDGTRRVVVINEDSARGQEVALKPPQKAGIANLAWLLAPGASATTGVTLDGQSFGAETATARLAGRSGRAAVISANGGYVLTLPSASAVMLTLVPGLTRLPPGT